MVQSLAQCYKKSVYQLIDNLTSEQLDKVIFEMETLLNKIKCDDYGKES